MHSELIAPEFQLHFSTAGVIDSVKMLEQWLKTVPTELKLSSHFPQNFTVKSIGENTYEVKVDFVWRGVTKDDKVFKATTHHNWLVVDDPNDRFAKIKSVNITQTEKLSPVE